MREESMFDSCRGRSRQLEAGAERFDGRSDYAAIGAVTNLASRLAGEASAGQILIDQRLYSEVEDQVDSEPIEFQLKGFRRPVAAFDIVAVRETAPARSRDAR